MREDIKKRWVEALRSGQYKQGKGCLNNGKAYCCLGVLCEILRDEVGLEWIKGSQGNYHARTGNSMNGSYLPDPIMEFAELEDLNPPVIFGDKPLALAYLNDNVLDFREIADLIESQL